MPKPYKLLGFHHVEWFVGNALQTAFYYQKAWGFKAIAFKGLETGSRDRVSIALQQGDIRFVVTAPLNPEGALNAYLDRHGDGVADVALLTDDASAAFESALAGGADPVAEPRTVSDEHGSVVLASIRAYHDVQHTFIQRDGYSGPFLPEYGDYPGPDLSAGDAGLQWVDHVVHNMPEGGMEPLVQWYQDVLGFHRFWSVDDKDIRTEYTSLKSIVVADESEAVKMPVNEPAPGLKKSQIQEFIDYNLDAGVQHLALRTDDILATIKHLRANGVDFLNVPDTYYDGLTERVGRLDESIERLRELSILVDKDHEGYMLQLFTKPIQDRPTLFFEVIQRKGSQSFGKGNFRALFEAIEREQERRGNL